MLAAALLALLALSSSVSGRLSPDSQVYAQKFDPPYDDRTLLLQLKVYDWWATYQDEAVIPKGKKFPILDDYCNRDPEKCPSWNLTGDVRLQFGPTSALDTHRLNLFLTDTGTRIPISGPPIERVSPGCSGQPGAVCCDGQEYTLTREESTHAAFKMWTARTNGTLGYNGTQVQNFRSAGAKLTVKAGYYSATVSWPNMFFQRKGQSSDRDVVVEMEFAADSATPSYSDLTSALTSNYTLLVPTADPGAPGFVVPSALLTELPTSLNLAAWSACRAASCGAPLGSCAGNQEATPFASWRSTTTATVVADAWNALGRGIPKSCSVLGNGQRAFMQPDFSTGAVHTTQFVSCDYTGTYLAPSIKISRQILEAGFTAPPPPSPPPPSPAPNAKISPSAVKPTSSPSPSPSPGSSPSQIAAKPQPPPPTPSQQGPAIWFVVTLPGMMLTTFNSTGQAAFVSAVQKAATGESIKPTVRVRSVNSAPGSTTSRKLLAGDGTAVDAVIHFAPSDATAASALLAQLKSKLPSVLPASQFGDATAKEAVSLNCVSPCGDNGLPGPRTTAAGVSCTCECKVGWATAPNQPFESFKYCALWVGLLPGSDGSVGTQNFTAQPPGAVPAPPPPKQYRESNGFALGGIVGVSVTLLVLGVLAYVCWRTKCPCFAWKYCAQPLWKKTQQCTQRSTDEAGDGAAAGVEGEAAASKVMVKDAAKEKGRTVTGATAGKRGKDKKKGSQSAATLAAGKGNEGKKGEGIEVAAKSGSTAVPPSPTPPPKDVKPPKRGKNKNNKPAAASNSK